MIKNYAVVTSKLFTPFASMFDAKMVLPFLTQNDTFKRGFLAVFFWFAAVHSALQSGGKKIASSAFMSIISFNHLLFSAAVEGRGGGGGGGHGGSRLRKIIGHDSFQVFFLRDIIINDYNLI